LSQPAPHALDLPDLQVIRRKPRSRRVASHARGRRFETRRAHRPPQKRRKLRGVRHLEARRSNARRGETSGRVGVFNDWSRRRGANITTAMERPVIFVRKNAEAHSGGLGTGAAAASLLRITRRGVASMSAALHRADRTGARWASSHLGASPPATTARAGLSARTGSRLTDSTATTGGTT
jgi:hypothetical protein